MGTAVNYAAVLCLLVAVLLYSNTLDCGLCFDDEKAIVKNVDLRPSTPWSNLLWDDFWGTPMESFKSHKSYRPLCVATFRLNYMLHELQPMGYHLVNVLLHGVVCYLYVQLCGVIFSEVWPALIAGLLFAVHPIHTEAVAGVVGRADVMAGLFYLTSIFAYRKAAKRSCTSYGKLSLCLVSITCSSLSKEVGITSAAVCLVYDFIFIQQLTIRSAIKLLSNGHHKLPGHMRSFLKRFFVLCGYVAVFMMMRLMLMKKQPVLGLELNPAQGLPSPHRQLHWAYLGFFNSWLLLSPSRLSPEYAMGTIPLITSLTDPRNIATVVTFIVLGLLAVFATHALKEVNRLVLIGLAMTVIPFIPASNLFFPVGFVVAERVLYLPSMGFCLLVGYGIWRLSKSVRSLSTVGLLLLLVSHSTKTFYRNRDWYSEHVLYQAAIKTFPNNGKMLHNLASKYANTDDLEVAKVLMRASTLAEPNYINAHSDLGLIFYKQGRIEEAEECYRHAVDLVYRGVEGDTSITVNIKGLKVFSRLAKILKMDSNRIQEAYVLLKDVLKTFPDFQYSYIYSELGDVLFRMGKYSKAKVALETAMKYDPKNMIAYSHLTKLYLEQGNTSLAEQALRNGIAACGPHVDLLYDLASLIHNNHHGNQQRLEEAEKLLVYVVSATPNNTAAQHKLGVVQYDLQKYDDAQSAFLRALNISPHHSGVLYDLARLYAAAGHCGPALSKLEILLEVEPDHEDGLKLRGACQNIVRKHKTIP